MTSTNRLTDSLEIEQPILLAPMNLVSDGRLAAAVTAGGGLGLIGAGYSDSDWLQRQFTQAGDARVGCGFITWHLARHPQLLEIALANNPAAIMLSFGDPLPFADRVHQAQVPLLCQVQTLEHARRALDTGVDIVVAQGGESGGHGGASARGTFSFVPEVVDLVAQSAPATLVVAAGGVADGRGLAAALALGADGVLVGTRFMACEEAAVSRRAQRRVVEASGDDTIRTNVYDVVRQYPWAAEYNARLLRNKFTDRWHGRAAELDAGLPEAAAEFRNAVAAEDFDIANVFGGEAIGLIHEVLPATEVIARMVRRPP